MNSGSTGPGAAAPTVSIGIPTYRGVLHLAAAIDSVLAQSFAEFELIIVDDNSPDETAELIGGYRDPRIRYLRNPANLGPQGNWNRCLDEARGTYFKLMPQDDVLRPDCLRSQVDVLAQDTAADVALVFCAREIIGPAEEVIMQRGYPGGKLGIISAQSLVRRCVRRGTNLIGEPGGVLFRRALARQIGGFDAVNPYVLDLDYWTRLLLHGKAYYLPQTLAAFRVSAGSWSVAIGSGQTRDFRRYIEQTAARRVFSIRALDRYSGYCMAGVNTALRRLFYRWLLNSKK